MVQRYNIFGRNTNQPLAYGVMHGLWGLPRKNLGAPFLPNKYKK